MDFVEEFIKNKNRILNILDPYYRVPFATTPESGVNTYYIPGSPNPDVTTASTAITANQVRVFRFYLPFEFTVGRLTSEVTGGTGGSRLLGAGIYSAGGGTLYLSTTFDASSSAVKTATITPVTLEPGFYLYAWTSNNNNPTATSVVTTGGVFNTILNNTTVHVGTAANASAAGILPATTGIITAGSPNIMVCVLEGT